MITKTNLEMPNNKYRLEMKNNNSIKPNFVMQSHPCATNFGGFTRLVMDTPRHPRPFHSTEDFLKIAGEFKSKTIGKIPKEFLNLFPEKPQKVFQFLDELSIFTRGLSFKYVLGMPKPSDKIELSLISGKKINLNYLGEGGFSKAFKMDFAEKSYVFKTFKEISKKMYHGASEEVKTGVNFSGENYKDVAKTHIGNFANNHEWAIVEYIDEKATLNDRQGLYFKTTKPKIVNHDYHDGNRIGQNNILVDMGGTKKQTFEHNPNEEEVYNLYNELSKIKKPEKKFYEILNSPNPQEKKGLGYAIDCLNWINCNNAKKYFYDVLNHPHYECKVGLENHFDLLAPLDVGQAHKDWIKYLKSQVTLFETDI